MRRAQSICLADHGRHRWRYALEGGVRMRRECQKCGAVHVNDRGTWRAAGSTRWVPLTPAEREAER